MEEWLEGNLHVSADELGIILAVALPPLVFFSRRMRAATRRLGDRIAFGFGRPQARYSRWFLAKHGTLRNIYSNTREQLILSDSYISLSLQNRHGKGGLHVLATNLMAPSGPRRIMITGDPGAGKSTLLKAYGAGILRSKTGDSDLDSIAQTNEIPVLITLRQISDALNRGESLKEHVVRIIGDGTKARDAAGLLNHLLTQSRLVLLLDGLDEISHAAYPAVRRAIHEFVTDQNASDAATSMSRVVITCRTQNYRQIEEDWSEWFSEMTYSIAPLDEAEIERFVLKRRDSFVDRSAESFLADVRASGTLRLHQVPLILAISAGLYTHLAGYEIPHSIGEFYSEMVRELLRRHDFRADDGHRQNVYRAVDKQEFLGDFALHLARTRSEPFGDFTYFDLLSYGIERAKTSPNIRDAREFIDEIIQRSGLLAQTVGTNQFAFAHRSFHEYLVASRLSADPQEGCRFLLQRLVQSDWLQVTVLFCGERHRYVSSFMRTLSDKAPELAGHCLATASVPSAIAADIIQRASKSSRVNTILEATKSPVPKTRMLAYSALTSELVTMSNATSASTQRYFFARVFGEQTQVAGKLLISMTEYAGPEMALAIARLAKAVPDNEPMLVSPLWHSLRVLETHDRGSLFAYRSTWREIVSRLLILAMDERCAKELDKLPRLSSRRISQNDRTFVYPLRHGLALDSNLVTLLALGRVLRLFGGLTRKNLYVEALIDPSRPLARLEVSPTWARINPNLAISFIANLIFYLSVPASIIVIATGLLGLWAPVDPLRSVATLAFSLFGFQVFLIAASRVAANRYYRHMQGAKFSRWSYLVPAVDSALYMSRVELLWTASVRAREAQRHAPSFILWARSSVVIFPEFSISFLFMLPYGIPIFAVFDDAYWLGFSVINAVLCLAYWLPSTELCGPRTVTTFLASHRYLGIYSDPSSHHWVRPVKVSHR